MQFQLDIALLKTILEDTHAFMGRFAHPTELLNGKVSVESTLNVGTTFTVKINL